MTTHYAHLPEYLRAVFEQDDAQRRDFEISDAQMERRLEEHRTKRRGSELVYKTHDPNAATAQQQSKLENDRAWNEWVDQKIAAALDAYDDDGVFARDIGKLIGEVERGLLAEIKALRTEIEVLRENPKFPVVKGFVPRLHREGELVLCGGGLYQARQDTAFPPGHSSWQCVAAPGERGEDGKDFTGVVDLPKWPRKQNAG